jgi:3-hydroxyacyl-CoA dehydrogenase
MIRAVAVLGAGTMGAQMAALFASVGVDVLVLDVSAKAARDGIDRLRKAKPDPYFTPDAARRIQVAGFDEGLPRLAEYDWIVEAIVERPAIKRGLLTSVDAVRRPGTIVSTNTSGLSIASLAEGRSEDFRRHWLGTHFFNPPRYLHLLEVVPGPDTDPGVVERVRAFADHRLGKGVVVARDTPNFIANHLGMFAVLRVLDAWTRGGFSIEEIDELTGPLIGRPKSATFRTLDVAGLDVLGHVAGTMAQALPSDEARAGFALPAVVDELINRGWLGEKTGQGFYKRIKLPDGSSRILVLDPARFEYVPTRPVNLPELDRVRPIEDVRTRIGTLFAADDRAGAFMRATMGPALEYAARVAPDISHGIDDVDRVMRWGFGWDVGPFEIMDAIGVPAVAATFLDVPPLVGRLLGSGRTSFRDGVLPPQSPGCEILRSARERAAVVQQTPGASLVDLGDGVLAVEFHSKMNTIGADALAMIATGLDESARNFRALVIGNEAPHFSAGANLTLVLAEAQTKNWAGIDAMVRAFQRMTWSLKYADVPVIAAPAGLSLGGGCEIALHADRVQAAAETYMGLVEVGVGLIPAGGGTKEMLVRGLTSRPIGSSVGLLPFVQPAFETMAFGKVSASGPDAQRLGYLRAVDGFTMNRDRLIADAKARALARLNEGYQPPAHADSIPVGGDSLEAVLKLGVHLAFRAGQASDHDVVVGRKLAWILAGGSLPHATTVTEEYLLDLEREAFLSLCGEPKTLERIAYTLKTGKTLRN